MKKKIIIYCIIILFVGLSGALGYTIAHIKCLQQLIDMEIRTRSYVLQIESLMLARKIDSSGVQGLIESFEQNGESTALFIRANKPFCSDDSQKMIEEALSVWEKTKVKLKALNSSYKEN